MGAVYRAWDTRLKIPVALKQMRPQPGLDPHSLTHLRQQFQQEATILARLKHSYLVNVTDFFCEGGNDYLVMEFVDGESLADCIARRGPLPEKHVLYWAHQLLQALAHCHDKGIIHRDVKPQNVIIDPGGRAVLVDFGLVKLWDPRDPRTRTVMRGMGTPQYAPPEQYDVAAGHTDARTDVYGLGATLYHALSGHSPPTATQRIASRTALRPLRELNPRISPATEAMVLRAMALAPEDRYTSAQEMAAALSGRAPAPPRRATPSKRHIRQSGPAPRSRTTWWIAGLGGLAALVLCAVIAVASFTAYRLQVARDTSAQTQASATAEAMVTELAAQATSTAQATQATATAQAQSRATATARAQTTATARARATATEEARLAEAIRAASHWPLILSDAFSSDINGWPTGDFSGERVTGRRSLTNDKYRWSATTVDGVFWHSSPSGAPVYDFYVTVEVKRASGVASSHYGLAFHIDEGGDNLGTFLVSDAGSFFVSAMHVDGWKTQIKRTEASAIRPGEVNRLTVISEGSHYTFLVNDEVVGEADYSGLTSGRVGVAIELSEAGDSAIYEFDNFELRAP